MDTATKSALWIIAGGIVIALLYEARGILAPFALSVFLFLTIEGFARAVDNHVPGNQRLLSRTMAILVVLGGFIAFVGMMAQGIAQFGGQNAADYERRINELIGDVYGLVGMAQEAPSLTQLLFNETGQRLVGPIANAVGELSGDIVLILIYVGFLFLAQSTWSQKLDRIFREPAQRSKVTRVAEAARKGIESYLWTQTVISVLITVLTYTTLRALGVENALFLSALIFVLNYIPTVGSIVAALVPPLFALVQPDVPAWVPGAAPQDSYVYTLLVLVAVSFWQFAIGNFLQPRMMGESLNLSALVVLLSLAIWGALWGIPGMFLSAPLTVLMMVLFAQSDSTRWVAVLLSADGNPSLDQAESPSDTGASLAAGAGAGPA
ncbi:MAG: AI-2E family transporter [Pseudomonadota bacterium]